MKKMLRVLLVIVFLVSTQTFAQRGFSDSPIGIGGGYLANYIMPKVDSFNKELKNFGSDQLSTSGMFSHGGAGFGYIGFLPNVRLGGMGTGGSMTSSVTTLGITREVEYTQSFYGLTVEYTLPFIKSVGISAGAILGGGNTSLTLSASSPKAWVDFWNEANNGSTVNYTRKLTANYFAVAPTLNVDIPLSYLVALRVGGGYTVGLGESWKLDNDKELSAVPSDVSVSSAFIQVGVFFGFFAY